MNIGIKVKLPKNKCEDAHCPFHGNLKPRGRFFLGKVLKVNLHKTVIVGWTRSIYIPKYERYEKRNTKLNVHKPDCIEVNVGDKVRIVETRPISKMKNFVIVEVIK